MRIGQETFEKARERERRPSSEVMAKTLRQRYPERLAPWRHEDLVEFVFNQSRCAEAFGLRSLCDVSAYVDIVLTQAPALEYTKEFQHAAQEVAPGDTRMVEILTLLPSGFWAALYRADASELWRLRMTGE